MYPFQAILGAESSVMDCGTQQTAPRRMVRVEQVPVGSWRTTASSTILQELLDMPRVTDSDSSHICQRCLGLS